MDLEQRHLSIEQIERLIETQPSASDPRAQPDLLVDARRHLETCKECQRLVSVHSEGDRMLRCLRNAGTAAVSPDCPADAALYELTAGIPDANKAAQILEHVVQCEHCSAVVREAAQDFVSDEADAEETLLESLRTTHADWQESFAKKLASLAKAAPQAASVLSPAKDTARAPTKYRIRWTYVYAAAAALLLGLAGLWTYSRLAEHSVDRLLLQAYAEQRTMELRISGARHAPLRQERGPGRSSLTKPPALLKAEYLIEERLASRPDDAVVLAEKGRAELLEWQYDDAIETLKHALDLDPDMPGLLCDLAIAYAQRAEIGSHPLDYSQAIEYLGRSLDKQPQDLAALFNRAVIEERLELFEEAKKDWERYLQIDPRGAWAEEARRRLEDIRRQLQKSSSVPSAQVDPTRAIAELVKRAQDRSGDRTAWPDSLDEDYLDVAVKRWLPALANWRAYPQESEEWRALRVLSRLLIAHHRDWWLADLLSEHCSGPALRGWARLGMAAQLNSDGSFDAAAMSAARAYRSFSVEGCRAGSARALWEQAYALQRSQKGQLCLDAVGRAASARGPHSYPWLEAQLRLERSICSAMVGRMSGVRADTREAIALAESAAYPTLQLRSMHIAGMSVAASDPDRAWSWFQKGLEQHWAAEYRPFRAYQFYAEMSVTPESEGQWHSAVTLMEEAVMHISRTPNRLMEAVARQNLAVDADLSGHPQEALEQFHRAREIFSSLPHSPTTRAMIFSSEVNQAALESHQGRDESALAALLASRADASEQTQYWDWLHYYQTLGLVLLRRGATSEAQKALRAAVYISESALSTITNDADRLFWERQCMLGYRSLVELEWEEKSDKREALEIWEWYKSAPVRNQTTNVASRGIDFGKLDANPPLPRISLVAENLSRLTDATVLSFARLEGGIFVWLFDARGVYGAKLSVSPEVLDRTARRFVRLCSDPSSNLDETRRTAQQLYGELLSPVEEHLDPSRVLVLEMDGMLQQIPFAALVAPNGSFLGERYATLASPGLGFWRHMRPAGTFSPLDKALVVGTSGGSAGLAIKLPPLPDAENEARAVSDWFADRVLLTGSDATLDAVKRELPLVRVFHFTGHAIAGYRQNGLLLAAPGSGGYEDAGIRDILDASELAAIGTRKTDLVVLSACSTGADDGGLANPESLVRVLLYAGVPTVVASRWNVDSRVTTAFMQSFYEDLRAGRSPSRALQAAAETVRRVPETAHPYYWAAFDTFGRN